MDWLVILYPSGTHMKHDGKMRGGIFHCHSEGGMVIHFFLSPSLSYPVPVLVYHSIFVFPNPPPPSTSPLSLPKQWQFNHILRSGMQNSPSSQSICLFPGTEPRRRKSAKDRHDVWTCIIRSKITHTLFCAHTAPLHLNGSYCGPVLAVSFY